MEIAKTLLECLEMIEDPRASYNRKHHFMDIMTIAILSVISGADTWDDMEDWGIAKKNGWKHFWSCQMAYHPTIRLTVFFH